MGDLTSAFDFKTPNDSTRLRLPDTTGYKPQTLERHADEPQSPPERQSVPEQERGVRPARAIPYTLHGDGFLSDGMFHLALRNAGDVGAVFQLRSADPVAPPRSYTVGAQDRLLESIPVAVDYDLALHGPNGFYRGFAGGSAPDRIALQVATTYGEDAVTLVLKNQSTRTVTLHISDRYSGRSATMTLRSGAVTTRTWSLTKTHGWYDLTVHADQDPGFCYRYAGHLENGKESTSDPLMGGLV